MEQWKGKVAIVTGASSGIGAAIAKDLAISGMITFGLARRVERVEALKKDLPENVQANLHAVKCDVSKEEEIVKVFSDIDAKFNGIDVLINNAGIYSNMQLIESNNSIPIREAIDTNILGLVFCTREAYKSMETHGRNSHVVHINSTTGHNLSFQPNVNYNIYAPTKYAVTAITEIHRQEFIRSKHHIKVTSISPGIVDTELLPDNVEELIPELPMLQSEDVSKSVLYVLGTPPHVQIHELTIRPFGEVFG